MDSIKCFFLQMEQITNWQKLVTKCLLLIICLFIVSVQPALAGIKDDLYDGNIFVVYAGNGSLVPPKESLAKALKDHKPTFLAFYLDDSRDCKEYAITISQVQEFYGRVAEIMPINVDTIPPKDSFDPTEPGYYYSGVVPQVVVFDASGKVVLNQQGQVPFAQIDDKFRDIYHLVARDKSIELKRRSFNEFSSELSQ
jgi:thiol-disulfide isomerase/thioredoxin